MEPAGANAQSVGFGAMMLPDLKWEAFSMDPATYNSIYGVFHGQLTRMLLRMWSRWPRVALAIE